MARMISSESKISHNGLMNAAGNLALPLLSAVKSFNMCTVMRCPVSSLSSCAISVRVLEQLRMSLLSSERSARSIPVAFGREPSPKS